MSLKAEWHSKGNIAQYGMSLNMNVTRNIWNVTLIYGMSLKMECRSKWNVTENGMSLKMDCHSI
jgi:hypothetical protein